MPRAAATSTWVSLRRSTMRQMAAPSRTFVSSSSASGRPMSAKTLPLLGITRSMIFLVISLLVILLRHSQTRPDQSNVGLPSFNAARRLLLKRVKYIDTALETNRVDRSVGVHVIILDVLHHPRPFAAPWLG